MKNSLLKSLSVGLLSLALTIVAFDQHVAAQFDQPDGVITDTEDDGFDWFSAVYAETQRTYEKASLIKDHHRSSSRWIDDFLPARLQLTTFLALSLAAINYDELMHLLELNSWFKTTQHK